MVQLDRESEGLLKEILENDKDFPKILADKLKDLDWATSDRLLAIINVLDKGGYIKIQWAGNLPYYGRIEKRMVSLFLRKTIYD